MTSQHLKFGLLLLALLLAAPARARQPEEAEFAAAATLGEKITGWIEDMEPRPNSIGVFFVHANAPLDQDYANVVEAEMLKNLAKLELQSVISCTECRQAQVSVEQDKLVISRGTPDLETLKRIGKKYSVEAFLVVELYRTKISVIAQTVLYKNPEGIVLNADRFRVPAVNISDSSGQILLTLGPGKVLSGKVASTTEVGSAINVSLLEELGFGKGGLNLGYVSDAVNGSLFYLNPTYGFRGHFGNTGIGWSLQLGVGYGTTSESRGITLRGAYDIYLGSLAAFGIEVIGFAPSKTVPTLKSYAGLHIGISIGR